MAKAASELLVKLEESINDAADGLPFVTQKRMFGCHALFANDAVFGLVWKEGRIGVRLPDGESFEKLIGMAGAAPWKAGAMTMSHWVLVPASMHKNAKKLMTWVTSAHKQALSAPKKSATKTKAKGPTKATKKPVAKKSPAKPAKKSAPKKVVISKSAKNTGKKK